MTTDDKPVHTITGLVLFVVGVFIGYSIQKPPKGRFDFHVLNTTPPIVVRCDRMDGTIDWTQCVIDAPWRSGIDAKPREHDGEPAPDPRF